MARTTLKKAATRVGKKVKRSASGTSKALTTARGRRKTVKKVRKLASRAGTLARKLADKVSARRRKARRRKVAAAAAVGAGVLAAAGLAAARRGRHK